LAAEDDSEVRDFVVQILSSQGYKVISASSGKEAQKLWAQRNEKIDLLLTDMVMPGGLSGRQLAEDLSAKDPALRVLFTSGYTPGMAGKDITWLKGRHFLAKPYQPATLVRQVRECLDGTQHGSENDPAKC